MSKLSKVTAYKDMFHQMKNFSMLVDSFSAIVQNEGYVIKRKQYGELYDKYMELKKDMDQWFDNLNDLVADGNESKKEVPTIQVYSDGGCRVKNNIKGNKVSENDVCAWAYLIDVGGEKYCEAQSDRGKTNNAMEITALAYAMKHLIDEGYCQHEIEFFLDSQYVLNGITKWRFGWRKKNWKGSNKKTVANKEMWQAIDAMANKFTNATYTWVKGHDDNEGNNYVDRLLNMKMDELES